MKSVSANIDSKGINNFFAEAKSIDCFYKTWMNSGHEESFQSKTLTETVPTVIQRVNVVLSLSSILLKSLTISAAG